MPLNKRDQKALKTLNVIARSGFTYKGDSHFRTYRQATLTLNRMERAGLITREKHDPNMYVLTASGRVVCKRIASGENVTGWLWSVI